MSAAPTECTLCPEDQNALELIETRFERRLCFIELRCRHCLRAWTGEVSMPDDVDAALADALRPGPKPRWRIITMTPKEEVVGRSAAVSATPSGHDGARWRRDDQVRRRIA